MNTYARKTGLGVPAGRGTRQEFDKYPTPVGAIEDLMTVEHIYGPIWECAAGNGDVHRRLEALGHKVISTELHPEGWGETGIDFLQERRLRAPNVITNPPFNLWSKFAFEYKYAHRSFIAMGWGETSERVLCPQCKGRRANMGKDKERRGGLTANLDTGKFEKLGPKGHNKLASGGAEDGAPNARSEPAISTAATPATRTEPPSGGQDDILDYVRSMTLPEIGAFCANNGIAVSDTPANGGVMKMRHLNAVKTAIRRGKALVK